MKMPPKGIQWMKHMKTCKLHPLQLTSSLIFCAFESPSDVDDEECKPQDCPMDDSKVQNSLIESSERERSLLKDLPTSAAAGQNEDAPKENPVDGAHDDVYVASASLDILPYTFLLATALLMSTMRNASLKIVQ
jgi:hypothetical protein